jgi:hypothetical protein
LSEDTLPPGEVGSTLKDTPFRVQWMRIIRLGLGWRSGLGRGFAAYFVFQTWLVFAFPTLNRRANERCAYGARKPVAKASSIEGSVSGA